MRSLPVVTRCLSQSLVGVRIEDRRNRSALYRRPISAGAFCARCRRTRTTAAPTFLAFIRAHSQRIIGFHLRDFKNNDYVELGTGDFPLHQVAATIEQIGWKGWAENEEERADHSQAGRESDRSSLQGHEGGFYIVNRRDFVLTGAAAAAAVATRGMDAKAYCRHSRRK